MASGDVCPDGCKSSPSIGMAQIKAPLKWVNKDEIAQNSTFKAVKIYTNGGYRLTMPIVRA